jgi:hypothetical protein
VLSGVVVVEVELELVEVLAVVSGVVLVVYLLIQNQRK